MTRKEIAKILSAQISEDYLVGTPVNRQKSSDWSKSIKCKRGNELAALVNVFKLNRDTILENHFEAATSGDGNELSRILTLHSSSLLAFLCFSHISSTNPIRILDTDYVEPMFEVKNDVIDSSLGKPSNIDVMLLNEDRTKVLFLESKFTEYLDGGRAYLSPKRYQPFFNALFKLSNSLSGFKACFINNGYCLNEGPRTSGYLGGIKQAFSHLLGIATGPAEVQSNPNKVYTRQILKDAEEITFASIIFNCNQKKFDSYSRLYNSVFRNEAIIKKAIGEVVPQSKTIAKLKIHSELLTYQDIFKEHELPEMIRAFYASVSESFLGL